MTVYSCTLKYQGATGPPEATCAMHKNWLTTFGHILRMLLLHWQWAEEHLLHLAHWKTAAHWGAQGGRPTGKQHGRQLL